MWKIEKFVHHEHLNSWDEEFVLRVYKDISGFLCEKSGRCVLIFPPLNNRRRYFIHKVGELFNVQTFSVGEGVRRLTVVCAFQKFEKKVNEERQVMEKIDTKKGAVSKAKRATRPDAPIYIPPAIRRVQKTQLPDSTEKLDQHTKQCNKEKNSIKQPNNLSETCNISKKILPTSPDIIIDSGNIQPNSSELCTSKLVNNVEECLAKYPLVPDMVNAIGNEFNVPEPNVINEILNHEIVPCNAGNVEKYTENIENDNEKCFVEINIETKLDQIESNDNKPCGDVNKAINIESDKNMLWESKNNTNVSKDNDQEQEELLRASEEINRKNKRIIKQSFNNSDILIISNDEKSRKSDSYDKSKINEAPVDCWEDLLDGGKLESELMLEITYQVGNVNISKAKEDYDEYKQKISLDGDYAHVLEIYDFPKEFQTRDLVSIIDSFKTGTYHIKWVDDNHALGVFSSGFVATEMLKITHPLMKLRPMNEASKQSVEKAIRYPNAMAPSAVRPQTCAQTARRMVTGALGLKLINAKEERAKEIKILKEAREKKKLSAKQQDDAWEGKPSTN